MKRMWSCAIGCVLLLLLFASCQGGEAFVWRPAERLDATLAYGIADAAGGTVYFQGSDNTLHAYDLAKQTSVQQAEGCAGLIDVTEERIYYRKDDCTLGILQRANGEEREAVLCAEDAAVEALLANEDGLWYIVHGQGLWRADLAGGNAARVCGADRLLYAQGGKVYATAWDPEKQSTVLFTVGADGSVEETLWEGSLLAHDYQLRDGTLREIQGGKSYALPEGYVEARVNGNACFYTLRDEKGHTVLWALDLESGKRHALLSVELANLQFADGAIYLTEPFASLQIQRVTQTADGWQKEWIVQ